MLVMYSEQSLSVILYAKENSFYVGGGGEPIHINDFTV